MRSWTTEIALFYVSVFVKHRFILLISLITSILFYICVLLLSFFSWFKFQFTHNIHCFLECFCIFIILNSVMNGENMYQFPIFDLVWSYHENYRWPCFKWFFFKLNIVSASSTSSSFLNSLVVLTKQNKMVFQI